VQDRAKAGDEPTSASLPSKHSGNAVAFAAAVGTSDPMAGIALVPVVGFVAWSRMASARHYPTDVIAGAAVGLVSAAVVAGVAGQMHRFLPWTK
jgi:membrane-associated phospholipid phosphatase